MLKYVKLDIFLYYILEYIFVNLVTLVINESQMTSGGEVGGEFF